MIYRKFFMLLIPIVFVNCTTIKPYQKMYLNNEDMALSARKIEQYEVNSQNYREGAAGANGSKAGGGCGCN